ncbi:MAG: large subunit ribosomal protein [Thermoleophilaceae bacterium]|nr:large subunit ribosomal protein [Thermoleophilaceae bacterium]
MNRDEKAAVIDSVAEQIQGSDAIFAVDYRGISVKQAMELRQQLSEAGTRFQVVKNRLTIRAADKAGAESLKELLEGPTAFAFVHGDAAMAAKAIATFRRQNNLLEFKGGTMDGQVVSVDEIESIARLPARDVLHAQFVGVLASPITGLVRGLASMIGGLASQLRQIEEQGLVQGEAPAAAAAPAEQETAAEEEAPAAEADAPPAAEEPAAEEPQAEQDAPAEEAAPAEEPETPAEEAPGDPVAEAETAEQEDTSEAPSEGGKTESEEG